jgi:hypothetical protein
MTMTGETLRDLVIEAFTAGCNHGSPPNVLTDAQIAEDAKEYADDFIKPMVADR